MSAQSDDRVGYKRPPRGTRWQKGQSGNPRKRKPADTIRESTVATVDRLLLASVGITLNGKATRVTTLEAIMYQLLHKVMLGNASAHRVLLKYKQFASQNMEQRVDLSYVESAYTEAIAKMTGNPTDE
jgi:predicted transcriptional regulator